MSITNSTPETVNTHKFKKTFKKTPIVLATSFDRINVFTTITGVSLTDFSFKTTYTGGTNIFYLAIENN